ncbi:MAG: alkaline phosphatase family protein [Planctomycetes bacterium]|nr:alkaline phosphatase family protein [Planctomycetota bacterium]
MNKKNDKKLVVIQVAGLSYNLLSNCNHAKINNLNFESAQSIFPALTCTTQASFRTASAPNCHGMTANGFWSRKLCKPMFWEQSASLVEGQRIWQQMRKKGKRVAMMFWQQSLGEDIDLVLSPAPIHKHHGGMIMDCYSKPDGLYKKLCKTIGTDFNLKHYWGPLANAKVGDWIASATSIILEEPEMAPDLLFTYLPSMDYDLQRFGPGHPKSKKALQTTFAQLEKILSQCNRQGYEVLIFGDYTITETQKPAVFPNRVLHEAGLFNTRKVKNMLYPDFYTSSAFAMVDHQIAHVYVKHKSDIDQVKNILANVDGIAEILDKSEQSRLNVDHANSGELVIVAEKSRWFAYLWWAKKSEMPDYASHVDIHNKPGYDPCELFFGFPPNISCKTDRIRGSHGRCDPQEKIAWAKTFESNIKPKSLIDLALMVKNWFNEPDE